MATQSIDIRVVDKTANALQGISRRLDGLNSGLLGINRVAGLATAAIAGIGGGNILRNIVNTTARFQDLRTTLNTVAGSARAGAESFGFIQQFATQTQFGVEDLTTTFIKLKTAGIEPTEELLTTFTDAAAVTTDQIGSLQAITDLFARTTAGGLGLEEINRLTDRGLPALDILQEKLGLNRDTISDFGKTAEGARIITEALAQGIQERFGGATAARINNISTQFSNLQISITNAAETIGRQGFAAALGETANELTKYIVNNKQAVREIGLNLTKAFLIAKDAIKLVVANIEFLGKAFIGFFALKVGVAVTSMALAFGGTLVKGIVLATRAVKALSVAMIANPIVGGVALAIAGVEYFTGGISKLTDELNLTGVAGSVLDDLESGFTAGAEAVGLNVDAIKQFREGLGTVDERAGALQTRMDELENSTGKIAPNVENTANSTQKAVRSADDLNKSFQAIGSSISSLLAGDTGVSQAIEEYKVLKQAIAESVDPSEIIKRRNEAVAQDSALQQQALTVAKSNIDKEIQFEFAKYDQMLAARLEYEDSIGKLQSIQDQAVKEGLASELELAEQVNNAKLLLDEEYAQRKLEIQKSLEDSELKRIERLMMAEKDLSGFRLSADQKQLLQKKGAEEKQSAMVADRIEFEKKSEFEKYQFGIQQAGDFFSSLGAANKKAFDAAKAFNIANAIMNTYAGATKALATYPPPFNFIAAAAVVASGLAQVSAIRSQQYTGRQRGGSLALGQATVVGEDGPELIVPKQPGTVIPREVAEAIDGMGGSSENVIVNFNISTVDAEGFDDLLIQRRGTITGIINQALQKRGKQGVV